MCSLIQYEGFQRLEESLAHISKLSVNCTQQSQNISHELDRLYNELMLQEEILQKQAMTEQAKLQEKIKGFNVEESAGWKFIESKGWDRLNQTELLSIAHVAANSNNLKLDRESKRRKPFLVKWFDDNLPIIRNTLNTVKLECTNDD